MDPSELEPQEHQLKRQRMSHACDVCRARKVRCDERQPSCGRCLKAGIVCTTTDRRGRKSDPQIRKRTHASNPRQQPGSSPNRVTVEVLEPDTEQGEARRSRQRSSDFVHPAASPHVELHVPPTRQDLIVHPITTYTPKPTTPQLNGIRNSIAGSSPVDAVVVESPMAVNTDNTPFRRQYLGPSSLQVMVQWLDLTFSKYGSTQAFSSRFGHGMRQSVEFEIPMINQPPLLPSQSEVDKLCHTYFVSSNTIFPILDQQEFQLQTTSLLQHPNLATLETSSRPSLACVYAVMSIGADEDASGISVDGTRYLEATYSLIPNLVAFPYFSSVQALLLLTIALMGRDKEGAAWQTLGLAIRVAHGLGMHRKQQNTMAVGDQAVEQYLRVWWSAYCLEKQMVFETGRPSMVADRDCDQTPSEFIYKGINTVSCLAGLARIQGEISSRLYSMTRATNAREHLTTTAEIDRSLRAWLQTVPDEVRPGSDTIWCAPELIPFVLYLASNYHQIVITLHRSALLFDTQIYQQQLTAARLDDSIHRQLSAGESICVSSARTMVALINNGIQRKSLVRLLTLTPTLLAIYTLTIHVIKDPWSWSSPSDLKLMESTSAHIQQLYSASGHDPAFYAMQQDSYNLAEKIVQHARAQSVSRSDSPRRTVISTIPNHQAANTAENQPIDTRALQNNGSWPTLQNNSNPVNSNYDAFIGDEWLNLFETDMNQLSADDISTLFGLPFVNDQFDFSEHLPL